MVPLLSPHVVTAGRENRREKPSPGNDAFARDESFIPAAVPRHVQLHVNAMHATGKVFFRKRLRADFWLKSFRANPLLANFLRHKVAKDVEFPLRHIYGKPDRRKADLPS